MKETEKFIEIFSLFARKWGLVCNANPILLVLLGVVVAIFIIKRLQRIKSYDVVEIELPSLFGEKIKVKPNHSTIIIAYKVWVELVTRKVALSYEEDKDVIVEVYNSWYNLFGILRELAKSIPAQKMREDEGTRNLVNLMIKVLNNGLRPHLTTWQAKFRKWYKEELENNKDKTPQEIQKEFPEYKKVVQDIKKVNKIMQKYTSFLEKIVNGK